MSKIKVKQCKACERIKDASDFYRTAHKDGLSTYCKSCIREQNRSPTEVELVEEKELWGKGFRPKMRLKDWDQIE